MEFRRKAVALVAVSLLVALACGLAEARSASGLSGGRSRGAKWPAPGNGILTKDSDRHMDVNNLNLFMTNYGAFGSDVSNTYPGGLFYPKGTDRTAIYAAGLWLGATVGGELRLAIAEYGQEYQPGRIIAGVPEPPGNTDLIVWKVNRFTGNPQDTAHVVNPNANADFAEDPLVHHGWAEYVAKAKPFGAPTRIYRLPDTSTPAAGDSVDVEGPDIIGDQMSWCVYNDADAATHNLDLGSTAPLMIQVEQTAFAFNRQGALGNTVFIKYKFRNMGTDLLEDMYVSQWSDPDLGEYTDDLVGCDTLPDRTGKPRSLGFVYNSAESDGVYGSPPPAVGFDFFQGPKVGGTPLPMTSFAKYINATDPHSPEEAYAWMQGLNGAEGGAPNVDPWGHETRYMVAGDPVAPGAQNWLDTSPADRRFFLSSGPFTMAPGDSQEVVVAIIVGQCGDRLTSITSLRAFDDEAQSAFDNDFDLASPPSPPGVTFTMDHGSVDLSWEAVTRKQYGTQRGYAFEGYNVYQGETGAGPWHRVATYDESGPPALVIDQIFNLATCENDPGAYTAYGSNSGIHFSHHFTQDHVNGGSLRDGTQYYYAVSSYAYNPTGVPKVLESGYTTVSVIPQREASGSDVGTASVSNVTYLRKDPSKPPATDVVTAEVVQPELVTGHTYKVIFETLTPPYVGPIGSIEDATIYHSWSVVDSTTNQVKLSGQLNRNEDEAYPVVDGVRVRIAGKYAPALQDAFFTNAGAHRRPIEGCGFAFPFFNGGAGYPVGPVGGMASNIDPAADPDSFTTVEVRFGPSQTQVGYRYYRLENASDGGAPLGRRYSYQGRWPVPFTAWDVVTGSQLDVGFVEKLLTADDGTFLPDAQQPASQDSTWNPSDDAIGDREYLIVFRRPYSVADKPGLQVDLSGGTAPVMWEMNVKLRAMTDVFDDGDLFTFLWANPAKDNDVYVFDTGAMARNNTALARGVMDRIRAVPNPYYAHSSYETNQFSRRLRFMNLPETCTIRIFNLAGQLVRTLEKTDATTSMLTWDLETRNGLPVGSGVYIFHVAAPGVGEYRGRVVVFTEKERLNNF